MFIYSSAWVIHQSWGAWSAARGNVLPQCKALPHHRNTFSFSDLLDLGSGFQGFCTSLDTEPKLQSCGRFFEILFSILIFSFVRVGLAISDVFCADFSRRPDLRLTLVYCFILFSLQIARKKLVTWHTSSRKLFGKYELLSSAPSRTTSNHGNESSRHVAWNHRVTCWHHFEAFPLSCIV